MFVLPADRRRMQKAAQPTAGRARRASPEEDLQKAVVKFLSVALAGNSEFFHVPNGGKRGFREAQRFKAIGVKAGVPDLIVVNDGRMIGIEMKAGKQPLSEAQVYYHDRLRLARVPVTVCRSIEDVEAALRDAGVPLRATTDSRITERIREGLIASGVGK